MTDPFAPMVVALTHGGFPMARPLPRREWEPILNPGQTLEELRRRVGERADVGEVEAELSRLASSGVWAMSWFCERYPRHLTRKLGAKAPPVLFGMGSEEILSSEAIGMVGSRNASDSVLKLVESIAAESARRGFAIVSGGAKGVDLAALAASGAAGGRAIAYAADSLAAVHRKLIRAGCSPDRTAVLTPFHPESGFTVGQAMGRNKLIYASSELTLVADCDEGVGGTWTGAAEALKAGWTPVAVLTGDGASEGNLALERLGANGIREIDDLFALAGQPTGQSSLDL